MIQELILDRYRIIERIGRGGYGEVLKAEDTLMTRTVAIKRIDRAATTSSRTLNEARAAGQLNHPNVVTVYDLEQDDEFFYLIMEYIDGVTLAKILQAKSPLSIEESLDIAVQIADALEAAHAMEIVHRDIKPDNIMITKNGEIKVTDFGIARLATSTITADGDILGTLAYMSPEQAKGGRIDARTDIFSLGVVIYQMLSGASPFASATPAGIVFKITNLEPQSLTEVNDQVSLDLNSLIMRTLEKKRTNRLDDVTILRHYLESMRTAKVPERKVIKPLYKLAKTESPEEVKEYRGPLQPFLGVLSDIKERVAAFVKRHRKTVERFVNAGLAAALLGVFMNGSGVYTRNLTIGILAAYIIAAVIFPRVGLAAGFAVLAFPVADYSLILTVFLMLGLFLWCLSFWLARPIKTVFTFLAPFSTWFGAGLSYPLIAGLLWNPLEALLIGSGGGLIVIFIDLFGAKTVHFMAAANIYKINSLAGTLNPIVAFTSLIHPFMETPLLLAQPALWGVVAITISVIAKRRSFRTDFYGLVAGGCVMFFGELILLTNFHWGLSYVDTLLKTFFASLIIPLGLLPILPRRTTGFEKDEEDDEDDEEEE